MKLNLRKTSFKKVSVIVIGLVGVLMPTLTSCSLITSTPHLVSSEERWNFFPKQGLPLKKDVIIYWNEYLFPFIDAQTDEDASFCLGLVHAHLRMGQLETMRMIARGRVSEMIGPFGIDVDKTLRILNLGKASPAIVDGLPSETKAWLTSFVEGINYYQAATQERRPVESQALNIPLEPWTMDDLVTVSRLAAVDVNWFTFFSALQAMDKPDFPNLWQVLINLSSESTTSAGVFSPALDTLSTLNKYLYSAAKLGSNALVVGKKKTKTGLIASDPHLGVQVPNFWLVAGWRSPSFHTAGLMIPGIPFVALGRNPEIAWGGTNLHGLSTQLIRLAEPELISARKTKEKIKVRGWFDSEVEIRETKWGPVLSDAPFFKNKVPFAFNWVGHRRSDEFTAFLNANRAKTFKEFHRAFSTYAVSGQNMLYVDQAGNIGHVLAFRQPIPVDEAQVSLVQPKENAWLTFKNATDLPTLYNPSAGFIASANNLPMNTKERLSWFYQSSDRVERLKQLVSEDDFVTLDDLKTWQGDVFSKTSLDLITDIKVALGTRQLASKEEKIDDVWSALTQWDGNYDQASQGAVAAELFSYYLGQSVFSRLTSDDALKKMLYRNSGWKRLVRQEIKKIPEEGLVREVMNALERTAKLYDGKTWGEFHRLAVAHPLSQLPLVGGRFEFGNYPYEGSNDTLMKASRMGLPDGGSTSFGANARFLADLGNIDENYFVLLGGQDGWVRSPNMDDQVRLWREYRYIKYPLSELAIKERFRSQILLLKGRE